jgi:hypothetical protein
VTSPERYNPVDDPDPAPCPADCGWLTDDPYGGPCWECRIDLGLDEDREPRLFSAHRVCDQDCMDSYPPARPVVTIDILAML